MGAARCRRGRSACRCLDSYWAPGLFYFTYKIAVDDGPRKPQLATELRNRAPTFSAQVARATKSRLDSASRTGISPGFLSIAAGCTASSSNCLLHLIPEMSDNDDNDDQGCGRPRVLRRPPPRGSASWISGRRSVERYQY